MRKLSVLLFLLGLLFRIGPTPVQAASFSFQPATGTYTLNSTWSVLLRINTDSQPVTSADIRLTYEPTKMEVVSITNGLFFETFSQNVSPTGTIYITAVASPSGASKTGSGTIANLNLKAKSAGTSPLSFVCQSGTSSDSNIYNAAGQDLINCSLLTNAGYTLTGTGSAATPTPTRQATTSALPVTGWSLPTVFIFSLASLIILAGFGLLLVR